MSSQKISQMPVATETALDDLIPIVQGGVNKSITKDLLLTAAIGEYIAMESADRLNGFAVTAGGSVIVQTTGLSIDLNNTLNNSGVLISGGVVDIGGDTTPAGSYGVLIQMQDGPLAIFPATTQKIFVQFVSNPSHFANPQPTNGLDAISRIAAAVSGLLGGLIP
jgi:hypothetical protein